MKLKPLLIVFAVILTVIFLFKYSLDGSTLTDGNIITLFGNQDTVFIHFRSTYGIYEQDGRADLVLIKPKAFNQPFTVEKTILKDVMVYGDSEEKAYVVLRDGSFWTLDLRNGKAERDEANSLLKKQHFEFTDIYCDNNNDINMDNPPKYPVSIFYAGDFYIKVTENPYIHKYSFSSCNLYEKNVRYFKAEYPVLYFIYDNGDRFYYDILQEHGRSNHEIEAPYREVFSKLDGFIDVTKLKYSLMKTDSSF